LSGRKHRNRAYKDDVGVNIEYICAEIVGAFGSGFVWASALIRM